MLVERKISAPESANQSGEILDPLAATDEKLRSTRVTVEVGLAIPINSSVQLLTAKNTGHLWHMGALECYFGFGRSKGARLIRVYASLSASRSSSRGAQSHNSRIHDSQSKAT